MQISSRLIFTGLLGIGLFLGLMLVKQTTAQTTKGSTLKFDQKKHTLYTPTIGTIADTLILAGSIDTDQIAILRFKNAGKLVWVGVKKGDRVKRGQAIASLDKKELQKSLQSQFNNYRTTLSQFHDTQETYKTTKENYLVTDTIQRILDRTQYSLDNSVINYELTDMAISEAVLTSPIEGIVTNIEQPFTGTHITPLNASFTIINPNSIYVKAEIDQESVNKVKIDQPVKLQLDSFPDLTIDSKITYIAFTPVSGQTSTVYEIRFELPVSNQGLDYRLGMDGDISIVLSQADNVLTIPTDAVNDDNGQKYVYLKNLKELVRHDIKTGIETDDSTQVIDGLTTNDQVIVIQN